MCDTHTHRKHLDWIFWFLRAKGNLQNLVLNALSDLRIFISLAPGNAAIVIYQTLYLILIIYDIFRITFSWVSSFLSFRPISTLIKRLSLVFHFGFSFSLIFSLLFYLCTICFCLFSFARLSFPGFGLLWLRNQDNSFSVKLWCSVIK